MRGLIASAAGPVSGGPGFDVFVFDEALGANNVDRILDLTLGVDMIELDLSIFTGISGGALAASAFDVDPAATSADHRIIYDDATGSLFYEPMARAAARK